MKKNLLAVAVLTASAFTASVFAADGTVNFKGSITDKSCTVDTASQNQDVILGAISKTAFATGAGSSAGGKEFSLVLKDCPNTVTKATVRFDGTRVPGPVGLLALTDVADKANGVGVQLLDDSNNAINLGNDSREYALVSTGANTLKFFARYYAFGTVSVGKADATTNFTIVYP
ncbi:fimbrial protein [Serratia inhibens]|uniref:Fimbrial protein n=1 Tax=Serratia inhibens TaxID=2338073 RepID=A0AA92X0U4_9GAMM|nr:fimbrial protein [Serratia inhibens]ANS44492.1 putative major fimbrial subunit LpfA [Serratia inhibens PRI-2C]RJF53501.1 fimbrial protein [Serratia inhibens]